MKLTIFSSFIFSTIFILSNAEGNLRSTRNLNELPKETDQGTRELLPMFDDFTRDVRNHLREINTRFFSGCETVFVRDVWPVQRAIIDCDIRVNQVCLADSICNSDVGLYRADIDDNGMKKSTFRAKILGMNMSLETGHDDTYVFGGSCTAKINGVACQGCSTSACDGDLEVQADCSNVNPSFIPMCVGVDKP